MGGYLVLGQNTHIFGIKISDVALNHGFHDTRIGRRFTVSEAAREELVDRLLELNHARYADEVARGLHQPKRSGAKRARPAAARPEQTSLLDDTP